MSGARKERRIATGHRERRWDTRAGTLQLQVPKLREGGYIPSFIEHRKRSEQALISLIQEAVVKSVSTRKIEAVLEELGIAGVSAGQVSQLCAAQADVLFRSAKRAIEFTEVCSFSVVCVAPSGDRQFLFLTV